MNLARLPDNVAVTNVILQALVRKLVEKNVLTDADVQALLFEAAGRIDIVGNQLTPQAAHAICRDELVPAFLGKIG